MMSFPPQKLSVIIPVYNEKETVQEIIQKVLAVDLPQGMGKEIIVVDDGSTDGTTGILQNLAPHPWVKIIFERENRGKTAAILAGLPAATGDFVLIQDADLEYSPRQYPVLITPILENQGDVVYGSRFKGDVRGMTIVNRLANVLSNATINLLYNARLTDFHTCFKLFPRSLIKDLPMTSKNFGFDTEVTVRLLAAGYRIHEVAIDYAARNKSQGKKMTWIKALETYGTLLWCWFLCRNVKKIGAVVYHEPG